MQELAGHGAQGRMRPGMDGHRAFGRRQRGQSFLTRDLLFDLGDDCFRFLHPPMGHEPAGALRDEPPDQHDAYPKDGSQSKAQTPSQMFRNEMRVQQDNGEERAGCRPQPPAPVDCQVSLPTPTGRDKFVDGGIDCCVFSADTCAGQEAEEHETPQVPGHRRQNRGCQIEQERNHEPFLPPLPVGEIGEHDGPEHRAGQVRRRGKPDFGFRQVQRGGMGEDGAEGGDDGYLESIQHPRDAERRHHQPVPSRPGQPVHSLRNVGGDRRTRCGRHFLSYHRTTPGTI